MFSIEKATLADCPLIQTLASNIWEPTYGSILSREQLDYMFEMMYSNEIPYAYRNLRLGCGGLRSVLS